MNLILLELSTHAFYELLAACSIDQHEQHDMKKHGCIMEARLGHHWKYCNCNELLTEYYAECVRLATYIACMQSHLQKELVSYLRKIQKNICGTLYSQVSLDTREWWCVCEGCEEGECYMVLFSERLLILWRLVNLGGRRGEGAYYVHAYVRPGDSSDEMWRCTYVSEYTADHTITHACRSTPLKLLWARPSSHRVPHSVFHQLQLGATTTHVGGANGCK